MGTLLKNIYIYKNKNKNVNCWSKVETPMTDNDPITDK